MEAEMCSCDWDGEPVQVHEEIIRTARKEHKCLECEEPILPGEKYHYFSQCFDGGWEHFKVCATCEKIRNDFCAPFGCLMEELYQYLGFDYVTGEWDEKFIPAKEYRING